MVPYVDELGVGLCCSPGTETVVQSLSGYIDVVEIEPSASWFIGSPESDSFTGMTQPKIFHGVGFPIGGALLPQKEHFDALNAYSRFIRPAYVSEHLGFNRFCNTEGLIDQIDFLLPPLQNHRGVETAVRAISYYKKQTGMPFAFGMGINYLQCRPGEMEDGEFIARIAEESDAFILLDLHILWTNQQNGRQQIKELLQQLPSERIIGLRISSPELLALADEIVSHLPCLKSMILDTREQQEYLTENEIRRQLVTLKKIWHRRNRTSPLCKRIKSRKPVDNGLIPEVWEYALGSVANSCTDECIPLQHELLQDPGVNFIKEHRTYQNRTVPGVSSAIVG
jgi:uncharacterized protein (UPF0276 family)